MFKKISAVVLCMALLVSSAACYSDALSMAKKKKKKINEGTAELKIYSTTDLHGQSVTYSYDTASVHNNGSMSQIFGVIKKDKKEIKHGTSLLVDCGDTIFGLGAKATMNKQVSTDKQYMYELMKKMKYDAITLGNHDFDYGFSYEKSILESSGLSKKVVLSNVFDAKTQKSPWATRRIIKKTLKTSKKIKKTIKIGVTGAVIPALTTHTTWKGILTTADIVESVREQVSLLKKEGADVIVVLAHTGIGDEKNPGELAENVGYQLTKIKDVDVICLGHTHVNYPSNDDSVKNVYSYNNVNRRTGLINGKIVVQEADHGQALGISSLKLKFKRGKVYIKNKKVKLRKINQNDPEDKVIVKYNKKYDKMFKELYGQVVVENGDNCNNYFGMIEDNPLIQLSNDAKIAHAQKVIAEKAPAYAKYPIIASTTYNLAGSESPTDYISSDGSIKLKDILNIQSFAQEWSKFYYLTGAQLKEALEWQASAYTYVDGASSYRWNDETTNSLALENGLCPVLNPEWEDWKGLTVFDGVEYMIDPTEPARYNKAGTLIDTNARRIKKLTCNGVDVKDDQIFVWVNRNIAAKYWPMLYDEVRNQTIVSKTEQLTTVIKDYLDEQGKIGVDRFYCDNNWQVVFPVDDNYLVKSGEASLEEAQSKVWYSDVLAQKDGYIYYKARFYGEKPDDSGPFISLAEQESGTSGDPVHVLVIASDRSGVSSLSYLPGIHQIDSPEWDLAQRVYNGGFTVKENGVYSVKAVDSRGNSSVKYVSIENINVEMATTPKVNQIRNTHKAVTGKAAPEAMVYVETATGVYCTKALFTGEFSCDVEGLLADDTVHVWQVDSHLRVSEKVGVVVLRYGANKPTVDNISNKKKAVTGALNDSSYCKVVAVRGGNVYIPKGQKASYKKSKLYRTYKSKNIVETKYKFDKTKKRFSLEVPRLYANQTIKVCAYDWISRPSLTSKVVVEDVAPNKPVVHEVIAQEGMVYGNVPACTNPAETKVTVKIDDKEYSSTPDSEGCFAIKTSSVDEGTKVNVTASDVSESGAIRTSLTTSVEAESCFEICDRTASSRSYIDELDNKTDRITGYALPKEGEYATFIIGDKKVSFDLDDNGYFCIMLDKYLKAGTKLAVLIRRKDGEISSYMGRPVYLAEPEAPEVYEDEITTQTVRVKIGDEDEAKAFLKIGGKIFRSVKTIKKKRGGKPYYYYIFKPKDLKKGKKIYVFLKNKAGRSEVVYFGKVKE